MSLFSVEQVKLESACASVNVWREGFVLGSTNGTAYTITKINGSWEVTTSCIALGTCAVTGLDVPLVAVLVQCCTAGVQLFAEQYNCRSILSETQFNTAHLAFRDKCAHLIAVFEPTDSSSR
jgi:hypothetical protein